VNAGSLAVVSQCFVVRETRSSAFHPACHRRVVLPQLQNETSLLTWTAVLQPPVLLAGPVHQTIPSRLAAKSVYHQCAKLLKVLNAQSAEGSNDRKRRFMPEVQCFDSMLGGADPISVKCKRLRIARAAFWARTVPSALGL